jgi:hypothetical protein
VKPGGQVEIEKQILAVAQREQDVAPDTSEPDLGKPIEIHRLNYEKEDLKNQLEQKKHELKEARDLHQLRKDYSFAIYGLTLFWLALLRFYTI